MLQMNNLPWRERRVLVDGLEAELALNLKGVFCLRHFLLSLGRHLASPALGAVLADSVTTRNPATVNQTFFPVVITLGGASVASAPLARAGVNHRHTAVRTVEDGEDRSLLSLYLDFTEEDELAYVACTIANVVDLVPVFFRASTKFELVPADDF